MTKIISNFQFILDTVISYKLIAKKKSSVVCYVVDNVKMIRCLQKEVIVGNDEGSCLIKYFSNKDDTDSDHNSD